MQNLEKVDAPEAERYQHQNVNAKSNRIQVNPLAIDWLIIEEIVEQDYEEEAETPE